MDAKWRGGGLKENNAMGKCVSIPDERLRSYKRQYSTDNRSKMEGQKGQIDAPFTAPTAECVRLRWHFVRRVALALGYLSDNCYGRGTSSAPREANRAVTIVCEVYQVVEWCN